MYQDLNEFYCVTVTVGQEYFETDGFYEPATTITLPRGPRFFEQFHTLHQWMLSNIPHHKPTWKHKWDIFMSGQIKAQLHKQEIQDFLTAIEQLPDALRRNIGGLHEIAGLTYLAQAIEMEHALGVADTSIGTKHRASHAYILESRCERFRIIGIAPVDCDEDDLESTRAELWGQIAIQTIVNVLSEQFNIVSGSVDTYGDNKDSLVKNGFDISKMAFQRFFRPNMGLKLLLLRLRQAKPKAITISPTHIKGHQDESKDFVYESAPQSVRRNIDMDELAGKFLAEDQHQLEPSSHQLGIPGQAVSLFINHQPINNNMHHHINLYYFGPKLESRFRSKNTIPPKFHSVFHWKAMERAFRATSERDKLSRFNLIHKKWVTNMVQAGWDGDKTPMCQLCTDREETVIHIFACPSTSTTSAYSKAVQKFKQSLQQCNLPSL